MGAQSTLTASPWMWLKYTLIVFLALLILYLVATAVLSARGAEAGRERLTQYSAQEAELSYGSMFYVDEGAPTGDVILSVHGLFGGYDQASDSAASFRDTHRIIAPARFGYLGSDIKGGGTPSEQVDAYIELLDHLGIDHVHVLGTSAGGTVAIRFALDHPERTQGLLLYSSAPVLPEKPAEFVEYQAPPKPVVNNYTMQLFAPLFRPVFGMDPETLETMVPIDQRAAGVDLDGAITNPDMARNYDAYPVERLEVPTLILHAKDDPVVEFAGVEAGAHRFPKATTTLVFFESGGHMMVGNDAQMEEALDAFFAQTGSAR